MSAIFLGPIGLKGTTGDRGFQGDTGAKGTTGSQGSTGAKGNTGSTGNMGFQGATGVAGLPGAKGTTGSQGSTGAKGNTGSQGSTGAKGVTGAKGTTGNTGAVGSRGFQGFAGGTGFQGNIGNQGSTGAKGVGTTGAQGSQGSGMASGRECFKFISLNSVGRTSSVTSAKLSENFVSVPLKFQHDCTNNEYYLYQVQSCYGSVNSSQDVSYKLMSETGFADSQIGSSWIHRANTKFTYATINTNYNTNVHGAGTAIRVEIVNGGDAPSAKGFAVTLIYRLADSMCDECYTLGV